MSLPPAISVNNVSKAYRIWETPAARLTAPLMDLGARGVPGAGGRWLKDKARSSYRDFWALKDISFEVGKGEAVGIIGRNGSGKSTLLQLIVGTLQPTTGNVRVQGRVAALLELGSGFNPDFTGRENVYLNAAVLGFSRPQVDERFAEILAFAEIGDFIDQPVKTYSSGMMLRLAFAVQTTVDPDVLIIDEALSVGDFFFQQKCATRMRALRERGTTLLFVSHDMASVRDLCQRAIYLRKGEAAYFGESQEAIRRYFLEEATPPPAPVRTASPAAPAAAAPRTKTVEQFMSAIIWGPGLVVPAGKILHIRGVRLLDEQERSTTIFTMGTMATFEIMVTALENCEAHVSCTLTDRYKQTATCVGTYTSGLPPLSLAAGESAIISLRLQLNFEAGLYSPSFAVGTPGPDANRSAGLLDQTPPLGPIEIKWIYEEKAAPFLGRFGPPHEITVSRTP